MKIPGLLMMMLISAIVFGQGSDSLLYQRNGLKIFASKSLYGDSLSYDADKDYNELAKSEGACAVGVKYIYTPLSLIGEYYSYERSVFDLGGGTEDCYRSPGSSGEVITINIKTQDTVSILDIIDEQSLVVALRQDAWVRKLKGIDTIVLASCKTFKEVLAIINYYGKDSVGNYFSESSFSIVDHHSKTKELSVRMVRKEYTGFNHYQYVQLGLRVKPLEKVKGQLNQGEVFYLGTFRGGIVSK